MTLTEYFEYIRNPLSEAKMRVIIMPPDESWTALRRFYQERGDIELRLSDLVKENAWLPMPEEVFVRARDAMAKQVAYGKSVVLLGMPGYLALLTDENKRTVISALRKWVDGAEGRDSVCLLSGDNVVEEILVNVFDNPRYRQGKQLIKIAPDPIKLQSAPTQSLRTEVMLVGADLAAYIPEVCDTFQKYLRHTEEHPHDNSNRRIVVKSEGRELAGLSAEVRQIVNLRDFARVFYNVTDIGLSEDALRWLCEQGKKGAENNLLKILKKFFFPEGGVTKRILTVFDECIKTEKEALFWLVKHIALEGSYLYHINRIMMQKEVSVFKFRSTYIMGDEDCLDSTAVFANERKIAIQEATAIKSEVDIKLFIERYKSESTSRIAPWLNCGTNPERTELLRRCAVDGIASNAVKKVYPEIAAYLNADPVFSDKAMEDYFKEYRELKIVGRLTSDFSMKARFAVPASSVQSRDAMIQKFASNEKCALLVVDAMGAEWLPMLVAFARERNLGIELAAIGMANLPTITRFNKIQWPETRRLPDIKRFDNIAHNGAETHEARCAAENLAAELDVIGTDVLPCVENGLTQFEQILVTADHGSSRLATLAWQTEPKLARTLVCEDGAQIDDWRYRERAAQGACPPEMEETLDGSYWVVRGYERLPKKGGGQGFELHGGATLEERIVPVVIFSHTEKVKSKVTTGSKRAQIIENNDFDL